MDEPRANHTKCNKLEKDKYHYITHMWNLFLKVMQINLFTKQKQTQKSQKQSCGYPRGKDGGEG